MINGKNLTRVFHCRIPVFPIVISTVVLSGVLFAADRQDEKEYIAPNTQLSQMAVVDSTVDSVQEASCSDSVYADLEVSKVQQGKVTFYSKRANGARTASGEIHRSRDFVAAHRTLPFGTLVRVTLANGNSVVVRINDRGPFGRGRVLDLSYSAAKHLGMLSRGVAKAKLEVLASPDSSALALGDGLDCDTRQ